MILIADIFNHIADVVEQTKVISVQQSTLEQFKMIIYKNKSIFKHA